ncbi:MarR family winged helix-turn-helix transcriptional regulator [Terasakiella pusilla]|jgi:DNA-binding MarR family transcriptional regulator|uniref:MarR family winged helix-turn-helix transcriptional regulator n=1 Tax=Terasakiella pusilla TaxID=64973 RepID=UPI00048DC78D|nr:MarR family transcriptional regulator [Terasakiella pusilla]
MSQAKNAKNTDEIVAQWKIERPDIDASPMAVCGDIWRASDRIKQAVADNAKKFDLDYPQFDVIMTLRRQGKGKTLSPSLLAKEMMLSTSAMTNRLDRLEKRGLIERIVDPNDRRGLRIALTDAGFDLVDTLVVSHVETEERMIENLTPEDRAELRRLLAKLS